MSMRPGLVCATTAVPQSTSDNEGTDMKFARTATALLLLAAFAATARAEAPKSREQVKAELRDAIRSGDVYPAGETGSKLNELYPERYPHVAAVTTTTRAQVKAELVAAIHDGTLIPAGEGALTLRDEYPARYPPLAQAPGRTREEVVAETREAVRIGDMYVAGESGLKLNQESQRYPRPKATRLAQAAGTASANAAAN
jgi:hypothetical protein